ncbi:hypothetical protein ACFB49_08450 [Sphingomonas sp. DBB INV C78]
MGYERSDRRYGRDADYGYRENRNRNYDDGRYRAGSDRRYGYENRQPADYDYDDRGFFDRAGDEVRSWFGDEEAERRRRLDERYAQAEYEREYRPGIAYGVGRAGWSNPDYGAGRGAGATGNWGLGAGQDRATWGHDPYQAWRRRQIDALDRDYADYRNENQSHFDREFGSWRTQRLGQRDALNRASEHQDVVGSDGSHVGTVDKVRGDRIILTKSDAEAGGRHHSIPCGWISSVEDGRVTLNRTAEQAQQAWKDEERGDAVGWRDRDDDRDRNFGRRTYGAF